MISQLRVPNCSSGPSLPLHGAVAPAAFSDIAKVDEEIKSGITRIYKITPSGVEPIPGDMVNPRPTRIYRAKTGKWEYMHLAGNPGSPIDGGDDDAALPDKDKST